MTAAPADLPKITVGAVLQAIEAEADRSAFVAAFDGDGTLWSGDVGEDYFHAFVKAGEVHDVATRALAETARAHAVDDGGSGIELCRRLFAAYEAGKFPEETICEVIAWCAAGRSWADARGFFEEQFPAKVLRARLHPETVALLEGVRRAGVEPFLVSASPKPVVEAAASVLGIAPDHVIAAEPAVEGGLLAPRVVGRIPYGPGKVSGLEARAPGRTLLVACGDNAFDEFLLRHARIQCAIRPKARLVAIAERIPGLSILQA